MTRVSFSDNNVLYIELPTSWEKLSQDELAGVYLLMSSVETEELPLHVFMFLAHGRVIRTADNGFLCSFTTDSGCEVPVTLKPEQLVTMMNELDFLKSPGDYPVRLEIIQNRKAVNHELHGVKFSDYIALENYYQGFIVSKDPAILPRIADILYPGDVFISLSPTEALNVINWMIQIKANFSGSFPNFFRPVSDDSHGEQMSQLEIMNNEIRALTGGDLTKEADILASDCWRALTELDFKAKEAEEFNRRMNKNK